MQTAARRRRPALPTREGGTRARWGAGESSARRVGGAPAWWGHRDDTGIGEAKIRTAAVSVGWWWRGWCVAGGLIAAAAGAWAGEPAAKLDRVSLQLKWTHQFQFAGYYAAVAKGYYQDVGLQVEIREGRSGMDYIKEVTTGSANFGTEMTDLLVRRGQGDPVVVLAAIFQHSPTALGSLAQSGIKSPHDLVGRRVMLRSSSDAELRAMMIGEGIAPERVQFQEHSFKIADLRDGRTDAMSMYYSLDYQVKYRDLTLNVLEPINYGIDFYGDCLFTAEAEVRRHPERVRAFRAASLKGWNYAMDHPDEIARLIHATYPSRRSVADLIAEAEAMKPLLLHKFVELGHMNPDRWRHIGDTYAKLGLLPANYALAGFIYDPEQKPGTVWIKWLAGIATVALLASILIAVTLYSFNRRLNQAVESRTAELRKLNASLEGEVRERVRTEQQLQFHSRLQEMLTRIATTYINLPLAAVDAEIGVSLGEMGRYVGADRCALFRYDFEQDLANVTHEWFRDGDASQFVAFRGLRLSQFPDWDLAAHRRGEAIFVADVSQLAPGALRDLLSSNQTKSSQAFPLMRQGDCIGFVAFSWMRETHVCSAQERGLLAVFAQMLVTIRQRQDADDALRESEAKFRAIFENAVAGLFQVTMEGRFRSVNRSMARMLGYESPEDMMQVVTDVAAQVYADPAEPARLQEKIRQSGRVENLEIEFLRKDGRKIWASMSAHPVADAMGRWLYLEGSCLDITDQKASAELQLAKARAESANRAKSAFLARMSHEIRTPMTAILGFTQLMNRDPALTEAQRANLRIIDRNGEHLQNLINDILEMSKIEARQTTVRNEPFDLRVLTQDLSAMFTPSAAAKGLSFIVEVGPNLPRCAVGDVRKLRQILVNLLGNAIKFTSRGGVVLRLRMAARGAKEWSLVAEVEDSGPGIADAEVQRLFQPFEQTKLGLDSGAGTGLGLAISREFSRLMGGDLKVQSEEGRGSVFRVEVCLGHAEATAAPPAENAVPVGENPAPVATGVRVLVVDDLDSTRLLLREMLAPTGCEIREAADGEETLEVFAAWQPQIILMDFRMPGMDGYEAIRQIRARPTGKSVKILCHSASVFAEDRSRAFLVGADDFVPKPLTLRGLWDAIARCLGGAAAPAVTVGLDAAAPVVSVAARGPATLPVGLERSLRQAVIELDFDRIVSLIGQVRAIDPIYAGQLGERVSVFDYDGLLALLPAEPPR